MNKRKICVVTGTRAEYGLFYYLLKKINEDDALELQIIATGMHLSPEFGLTYKEIENDSFKINRKVEMLLSGDTPSAISKSTGLGLIGFSDAFNELKPDLLVVLGDRFEILPAVIAASFARIPIAHFHGGEATEGLVDESIRHSITKMSHFHFVGASEYRRRVIQMGENPDKVYNIGGMGVDIIKKLQLLEKRKLEKQLDFIFGRKNLLITFHPVTLENSSSKKQFQNLLDAFDNFPEIKLIFTKPNSDTDGRIIINMIEKYVAKNYERSKAFTSMGQLKYLSTLQYVDGVVGNSSSGLAEVPSFRKGTINIGDRQKGRLKALSIIDCIPTKSSIIHSITKLYSVEFQKLLPITTNPYGDGGASAKAFKIIKNLDWSNVLKKEFFNIDYSI